MFYQRKILCKHTDLNPKPSDSLPYASPSPCLLRIICISFLNHFAPVDSPGSIGGYRNCYLVTVPRATFTLNFHSRASGSILASKLQARFNLIQVIALRIVPARLDSSFRVWTTANCSHSRRVRQREAERHRQRHPRRLDDHRRLRRRQRLPRPRQTLRQVDAEERATQAIQLGGSQPKGQARPIRRTDGSRWNGSAPLS